MNVEAKKKTNIMVVAMLVITVVAGAFWILALGPKRDEARKLDKQVEQLKGSLAQHQSEVTAAEEARDEFPLDYQHLVVLGKAVPSDDETPSLLIQVNRISERAKVRFQTLTLEGTGSGGAEEGSAPTSTTSGEPVSATEVAASLMPLGASIGPAGLAVMPYSLTFTGDFSRIADFIKGLDSLVKTTNEKVGVDGRLITINGFSLSEDSEASFPDLQANFSVTTYLSPPTADASAAGGASAEPLASVPAATTTGGAP